MRTKKPNATVPALSLVLMSPVGFTWSDLSPRPADHVRGSQRLWPVGAVLNMGSFAYWVFGRRHIHFEHISLSGSSPT